jgi:hypothetical protein
LDTGGQIVIRAQLLLEGENEMVFLFFAPSSTMALALRQKRFDSKRKDIIFIDCYFKVDRQPIELERISPTRLTVSKVPLKLRTTLSQHLKAYRFKAPFVVSKVSRPVFQKN